MERVDLVSVAILWSIGLLALIHAVNARGHFRIAITWILSLVIFALAFFFSSLKAIDLRNLFSGEGPVQGVLQGPPPQAPPFQDSLRPHDSSKGADFSGKEYRSLIETLLKQAKDCAQSISEFPSESAIRSMSASQFEKMESRARALRNQSSALHRQLHQNKAPEIWAPFHSDLVVAFENLRLAGYEIHALFGSEDPSMLTELQTKAQKHRQLAQSGLTDAEKRLETLP